MVNVNSVYSSGQWLKAEDLQGRDATVIITDVSVEQFDNNGRLESKLALSFQGKQKRLLCNKTNASRMTYMFGDETDNWVGKQITLGPEMVDFKGEYVPALRIRAQPQGHTPAAMANAPAARPTPGTSFVDGQPVQTGQPMTLGQPSASTPPVNLDDDIPF